MVKGTNMDRILKVMSAVNEYFEKESPKPPLSKLLHIYGGDICQLLLHQPGDLIWNWHLSLEFYMT